MSESTAPTPPPADRIENLQIEQELQDSYLTYAMSTIMDRALPDVRDGLKPSQRRILVAMHDLGLGPTASTSKCAGIVGETMKRYHPHGEATIYPTLVRMAQDWNLRHRLVLRDVQPAGQKVHRVLNGPAVGVSYRSQADDPDTEGADLEGQIFCQILDRAKRCTNRGGAWHVSAGRAARHENNHAAVLLDHVARGGAGSDKARPYHRGQRHHELRNR